MSSGLRSWEWTAVVFHRDLKGGHSRSCPLTPPIALPLFFKERPLLCAFFNRMRDESEIHDAICVLSRIPSPEFRIPTRNHEDARPKHFTQLYFRSRWIRPLHFYVLSTSRKGHLFFFGLFAFLENRRDTCCQSRTKFKVQ